MARQAIKSPFNKKAESETRRGITSGEGVAASTGLCGKSADPTFPLLLHAGGGSTGCEMETEPQAQAALRGQRPCRGGNHPSSTSQPGRDFPLFIRTAGLAHKKVPPWKLHNI